MVTNSWNFLYTSPNVPSHFRKKILMTDAYRTRLLYLTTFFIFLCVIPRVNFNYWNCATKKMTFASECSSYQWNVYKVIMYSRWYINVYTREVITINVWLRRLLYRFVECYGFRNITNNSAVLMYGGYGRINVCVRVYLNWNARKWASGIPDFTNSVDLHKGVAEDRHRQVMRRCTRCWSRWVD